MCGMYASTSKDAVAGENFFRFRELAGKKNKINDETHEHGWGIAGYLGNWTVHFGRSARNVLSDSDQFVSAVDKAIKSRSRIILAHLRNASIGDITVNNTHPFIHKEWVFCHNGTIHNPGALEISGYKYEGSTDSEKLFAYLISRLSRRSNGEIGNIIESSARHIKENFQTTSLTFLLSNGEYLIGFRDCSTEEGYYTLFYKRENNSLMFCSEPLQKNDWKEMKNGQLIIANKFGEIIQDTFIGSVSDTERACQKNMGGCKR